MGEYLSYTVERLFAIPIIKNLLKKRFKITKITPVGFFPFFIFK